MFIEKKKSKFLNNNSNNKISKNIINIYIKEFGCQLIWMT